MPSEPVQLLWGLPIPVVSGLFALSGAIIAGTVATTLFLATGRREAKRERTRLLVAEQDKRLAALGELLAQLVIYFHLANELYLLVPPEWRGSRPHIGTTTMPRTDLIDTPEFEAASAKCREQQVKILALAETYGMVPPDSNGHSVDLGEHMEYVTDECQEGMILWKHAEDELPIDQLQMEITHDLRRLKKYELAVKTALIKGLPEPKFRDRLSIYDESELDGLDESSDPPSLISSDVQASDGSWRRVFPPQTDTES